MSVTYINIFMYLCVCTHGCVCTHTFCNMYMYIYADINLWEDIISHCLRYFYKYLK